MYNSDNRLILQCNYDPNDRLEIWFDDKGKDFSVQSFEGTQRADICLSKQDSIKLVIYIINNLKLKVKDLVILFGDKNE